MSLRSATTVAIICIALALTLRILLTLSQLATFALPDGGVMFRYAATMVGYLAVDVLAYGSLLVFLVAVRKSVSPEAQ